MAYLFPFDDLVISVLLITDHDDLELCYDKKTKTFYLDVSVSVRDRYRIKKLLILLAIILLKFCPGYINHGRIKKQQ